MGEKDLDRRDLAIINALLVFKEAEAEASFNKLYVIADKAEHMSLQTFSKHLRSLVEMGFIRKAEKKSRLHFKPKIYSLTAKAETEVATVKNYYERKEVLLQKVEKLEELSTKDLYQSFFSLLHYAVTRAPFSILSGNSGLSKAITSDAVNFWFDLLEKRAKSNRCDFLENVIPYSVVIMERVGGIDPSIFTTIKEQADDAGVSFGKIAEKIRIVKKHAENEESRPI